MTDDVPATVTSRMPTTLDQLYRLIERDVRGNVARIEMVMTVTDHHRPLVERASVLQVRLDMAKLRQIIYPAEDNTALRIRLADELTEVLAQLALLPEADQIPGPRPRRKARA